MKAYINPYTVANTVQMARAVRKHASALILEGSKDVRVFRNLVNEANCLVVSAEGKTNALGALNRLRRSNQKGVLVVIDSDFSVLNGQQIIDPDVVTTDLHDLEAMLVKSSATQKVIVEYDLNENSFKVDGEVLARAVMPIGYLRLISLRNNLNLNFNDLDFSEFTESFPTIRVDGQKLVTALLRKNAACPHKPSALIQLTMNIIKNTDDPWHVSCGHDMTELFALLIGSKVQRKIPPYTIERQLRLAYNLSHFTSTGLFSKIREWEHRNVPYTVLS